MLNKQVETDDASEWAGWIFADMLVGLMVVFLATITFVPAGAGISTSQQGNYTYTEHFEQQFTAIYTLNQIKNIPGDIKLFLVTNSLPADAIVDSAMFIGGVETKDGPGHGVEAALEFSNAVDAQFPKLLDHASTTLNSSTDIATNKVALVLTFSANVTTNR